jgi:hypothetical protein
VAEATITDIQAFSDYLIISAWHPIETHQRRLQKRNWSNANDRLTAFMVP